MIICVLTLSLSFFPIYSLISLIWITLLSGIYCIMIGKIVFFFIWLLVYIGGIIIVFVYIIFFSNNPPYFHFFDWHWSYGFLVIRFFCLMKKYLFPRISGICKRWSSFYTTSLITDGWFLFFFLFWNIFFILFIILRSLSFFFFQHYRILQ